MVKGRNEPARLDEVAHALAGARGQPEAAAEIARAATRNAYALFLPQAEQ